MVANAARRDKERKCSELVEGLRCKLVVVAIETGGRAILLRTWPGLSHAKLLQCCNVLLFWPGDGVGRACFQFLVVAHSPVP